MRTTTYGGAVSVDGFLAGPRGELDWLHFSRDVQEVMAEYWARIDTVVMGRKTYAAAAAMQPPARNKSAAKRSSAKAPAVTTYVFSRTLRALDDAGAELVRDDAATFVRRLKQQPGKEICVMGGGELAQALFAADLIDRVGLNIHPVVLGAGIPAFRDPGHRVALQLTECRTLDGGCVLVNYDVRQTPGPR